MCDPGQESGQRIPPSRRVLELRRVASIWDDSEPGTWDGGLHLAGRVDERGVLFADDHERRKARRQKAKLVQGIGQRHELGSEGGVEVGRCGAELVVLELGESRAFRDQPAVRRRVEGGLATEQDVRERVYAACPHHGYGCAHQFGVE